MWPIRRFLQRKKVASHWDRQLAPEAYQGTQWFENPAIMTRMNLKVSGRLDVDPYQWLIEFMSRRGQELPLDRCLTLGCGAGVLERGLCKYGFTRRHEGVDIASGAIKRAQTLAREAGLDHLHYDVVDVETLSLPPATYDAVLAVMAIHHFQKLEWVFDQVRAALKPGGLFFFNEYIGPNRLQYTSRQQELCNDLLAKLPARYRRRPDGSLKETIRTPTVKEMLALDPSEASRSEEILPLLQKSFRVLERRDFGGTILAPLMFEIAMNFDTNQEEGATMLQMLFDAEDSLLEQGEISSDFGVVIAEPR